MPTIKVQTGIRFQPEILGKISYIAKQNHRSLNAQLEYLSQLCIEEYEKTHGEIQVTVKK